jgi:hypothetical protein
VDLFQWWKSDLVIMPSGDLLGCPGIAGVNNPVPSTPTVEGEQRVLRRLMTPPGSYIWHSEYGAGLPSYVGSVATPKEIGSLIRGQMLLEASVAADPLPTVTIQGTPTGALNTYISYADAKVGRIVTLGFDINA